MAAITAALVKELRDKTGAGMMDCKAALSANDGNLEAAIDWLRAKGLAKAAKKAGRVAAEGLVAVAVQGKRDQELLRIDARHDGRGNPYFWIAFGRGGIVGAAPGSDLAALNENRIAVTPLRLDLTDEPFMTRLADVFG